MSYDDDHKSNGVSEAFDVDGMLGGLARWLRILGFDTEYPRRGCSEDRYFVTANKKMRDPRAIVVKSNNPAEQLREVLDAAHIFPDPELFLTRCLICNTPVRKVSREKVRKRVPAQIYESVTLFNECPRCGRIYWEGSHSDRILRRLKESGIPVTPSARQNSDELSS